MPTKQQLLEVVDSLTQLINDWNDADYEPDERGRGNNALCIVIWDDGSGKIGTVYKNPQELNVQHTFDTSENLVAYLSPWLEVA